MKRGFGSDNNSGVHPQVLEALGKVNEGHVPGYGADEYTQKAVSLFKKEFGDDVSVFFVFNGTGANVLGLSSLARSFNSIICAETAHIQEDECGAVEKTTGCKLIPVETHNGKITPKQIHFQLKGFGFEHHSQPGIIYISESTELGTLYTPGEISAIADLAHQHGMYLYMDGARISNAAVSLGLPFRTFTRDAGVDALSFGGTKNGMMFGEAVLLFNPDLAKYTKYIRKQNMQLYSKMRFISGQFLAYFENELWKQNASHANRMAKLLESELKSIPQVQITQKVEANGVFAIIPPQIVPQLQEKYFFYMWDEFQSEARWMCSFDTQEEDIYQFVALIKSLVS